jgi:hypothetical protein
MCGAQNNGDQNRCWQCDSLLLQNRPPGHLTPGIVGRSHQSHSTIHKSAREYYLTAAIVLLLLSAFVGAARIVQELTAPAGAPMNLASFFQHHMTTTRLVLGAALIVLSPPLLNLALRLLSLRPECTGQRIVLVALMPPSLAFVLSWLPLNILPLAVLAPAVLGWLLIQKGLSLSPARTTLTWCIHGLFLLISSSAGFWALESLQTGSPLNPVQEFAGLTALSSEPEGHGISLAVGESPASPVFAWNPSGSVWLDGRGNRVQIEVRGASSRERDVRLVDSATGVALDQGRFSETPWHSEVFSPSVQTRYQLHVPDGFHMTDSVVVRSLLAPSEPAPLQDR